MAAKEIKNVAYLSLGGNLGNRLAYLAKCIAEIKARCGKVIRSSGIYESEAWGTVSEQKYLNKVIEIRTRLSPQALLKEINNIEKALGRKRTMRQFEDRVIDIDILFYNNQTVSTPRLQIPHPRLHLRKFVLVPLCSLKKTLVHPIFKKTCAQLLLSCEDLSAVKKVAPTNAFRYISIEGNIGSGKTTLARELARKMGATFLSETFEENYLLPLFYDQPRKYALPLEFSFLLSRFNQLREAYEKQSAIIVSDYSFHKSLWFGRVNLQKKEFELFRKHYKALAKQLPEPDLIIYLTTSTKNLSHNIRKRGRTFEDKIDEQYLDKIAAQYQKGLKELKHKNLPIRIEKYHPALEKTSIAIIEDYLKENFAEAM